jgi:glyoxylase-like metal-dependent hydrolase (beta-lactamase superfamily II)/ferredoxin
VFSVNERCIACDTCRTLAPATFGGAAWDVAHVEQQPSDDDAHHRARLALVSCPVAAIVERGGDPAARLLAARSLPEQIDGLPSIYYCGYASEHSYGAHAYLIVRPGGNVLVDSPRAAKPLLARIAALGGVRTMFLTHRDDVADHAVFARAFGCERVIHAADAPAVRGAERTITGAAPVALGDGLLAIPVPGHTRGSMALLWHDVLFTGDHLWWNDDDARLEADRSVCWYSWTAQLASLRALTAHRFRHVLPGHGRRHSAASPEEMRAALDALLASMR